MILFNLFRYR